MIDLTEDLHLLQFDTAEEFRTLLAADEVLRKISGLSIDVVIDLKALATTPAQGNKRIIIFKEGHSPIENKMGSAEHIRSERIRIVIIIRSVPDQKTGQVSEDENAEKASKAIAEQIEKAIWLADEDNQWLGTGWMHHHLESSGFAVPPTKLRAYYSMLYVVDLTVGVDITAS